MNRARRWWWCAAVAGASMAGVAQPAAAATAVQAGWWASSPLVAAPDVPEGGLLLQGGPTLDAPAAYAAVRFTLEDGEQAGVLTLAVVEGTATTPDAGVAVCALTEPFTPAAGGSMDEAPAFDCTQRVDADRSDDGATFTADVAGFATDGAVAVALLPTALTDRAVLQAPTTASLDTTTALPPAPRPEPGPSPRPGRPGTGTIAPRPAPPVSTPPVTATVPTSQPDPQPSGRDVPVEVAGAVPGEGGSANRAVPFLALIVLAGALWLFAGMPRADVPATADPAPSTSGGAQP